MTQERRKFSFDEVETLTASVEMSFGRLTEKYGMDSVNLFQRYIYLKKKYPEYKPTDEIDKNILFIGNGLFDRMAKQFGTSSETIITLFHKMLKNEITVNIR